MIFIESVLNSFFFMLLMAFIYYFLLKQIGYLKINFHLIFIIHLNP